MLTVQQEHALYRGYLYARPYLCIRYEIRCIAWLDFVESPEPNRNNNINDNRGTIIRLVDRVPPPGVPRLVLKSAEAGGVDHEPYCRFRTRAMDLDAAA